MANKEFVDHLTFLNETDVECTPTELPGGETALRIKVARNKIVSDNMRPVPPTFDETDSFPARVVKIMNWRSNKIKWLKGAKLVPIGLKYDGAVFIVRDNEQATDILKKIRDAGYTVPNHLIDTDVKYQLFNI